VYDFISEGDSPAYLHLIDVGLDNLNQPQWGGWGGRLVQSAEQPNRWEDGKTVSITIPLPTPLMRLIPKSAGLRRFSRTLLHGLIGV
jgi:hypothetical protein